ncbi:transcription factor IIB [Culex quinquefasciatus]|uniref:Transcription factor IIB n=1 Tax=Culex quinquefasciatus TaxID=7176 RepID=B0WXH3_CULQU|nr:transcription factor IIB [Culex quinquefasciatus]|eukprot:XP_001862095.1 transcription factor IIB [Culex quinquefasciatus]
MMKLAPRTVCKNDISLFHVHSEKLEAIRSYKKLTMEVTFHKLFREVNVEHLAFTECVARYRALQELLDYIKTTFSAQSNDQIQIDYISSLPTMRCSTGLLPVHHISGRLFVECVLDDKNVRRRFRASNYQSTTRVKPFICTMPMRLDEGWNQIQFNLSDFTRRAYGTNYVETLRVQIHANCRIRRVYFSDRLYSEDELPAEFKLFLPIQKPQSKAIAQQAC